MRATVVCGLAMVLGLATVPAFAEVSAAGFDSKTPIKVTGTVTKVDWINPNAWLYLGNVKNSDGSRSLDWQFVMGSPNGFTRQGLTSNCLKIGDVVTVSGYRAKDHTNTASARTIKLPDGRTVLAGGPAKGTGAK